TRPIRLSFPFTGLIRCGECGRMITAEEKHQLICSGCRTKFAHRGRTQCPNCSTLITEMTNPTVLRYEYYHCTKRREPPRCSQGVTTGKQLETQINQQLARLEMSDRVLRWVDRYLEEARNTRHIENSDIRESQRRAYSVCLKQLENLVDLKTSPRNFEGRLLSDFEYEQRRTRLLDEKTKLEAELATVLDPAQVLQAVKGTLAVALKMGERFRNGGVQTKRRVLATIGSNLTLRDKTLSIDAKIPFRIVADSFTPIPDVLPSIEPEISPANTRAIEGEVTKKPTRLGGRTDVRTSKQKV